MGGDHKEADLRNAHGVRPGRKVFIPLENNPEVMNPLAHGLGLSPSLSFQDVYSLTDLDLLALLPRPCHALLFLFPISERSDALWHAENATFDDYRGAGPDEPVVWFSQTIGHACGLIGMLHCVCNVAGTDAILPQSDLARLLDATIPLGPEARAQVLYDSAALEKAHAEAAQRGNSTVPSSAEDPGHGYVAFVKGRDGNLWELEGRGKGPINRGPIGRDEDLLSELALIGGPGRFLKRNEEAGGEGGFSCLALTPSA